MVVYEVRFYCDYCGPRTPARVAIRQGDVVTHACRPCANKYRHGHAVTEFWGTHDHAHTEERPVLGGLRDLLRQWFKKCRPIGRAAKGG